MAELSKKSQFFINLGQGLSIVTGPLSLTLWDSASRPKRPRPGTIGFNYQTSSLEYWDGDNWLTALMS